MIKKKKSRKKTTAPKSAKKVRKPRLKKEINIVEVRKQVSQIVKSGAAELTQAVVGEGMKGQVAPVRYLFEMANIFPVQENAEQETEEEDSLAKILLSRMQAPAKPEKEEDDEAAKDGEQEVKAASSPVASGHGDKETTVETPVGVATSVT
jgi:hypothetical protein